MPGERRRALVGEATAASRAAHLFEVETIGRGAMDGFMNGWMSRDGHRPETGDAGIGIGLSNTNTFVYRPSQTTTLMSPQDTKGGAVPQLQSRMVREQESAGTQRRRVSCRRRGDTGRFLVLNMTAPWLCTAASSPVPKAIQNLYDKKEYQRALDEVAKLDKENERLRTSGD